MNKAKYTHDEMVEILLSDPAVKNAYEEFEPEFALLEARLHAGQAQEEVAKIIHTTKSIANHLEKGDGWPHSPNHSHS